MIWPEAIKPSSRHSIVLRMTEPLTPSAQNSMAAVSDEGSTVWVLLRRFELLIEALGGVAGPGAFPLARRQAREGEQPVAGLLQAGGHGSVAQPPLAEEGLAARHDLCRGLGVDHVAIVGRDLVAQLFRGMRQEVAMLVDRATLVAAQRRAFPFARRAVRLGEARPGHRDRGRSEAPGELPCAVTMPVPRNTGPGRRSSRIICRPAVTRSRQSRCEFLFQQGLDEAPHPRAQAGLDRIKPAVKQERALTGRRCGRVCQGVVPNFTPALERRRCQGSAPRRLRHLQFQPTPRRHRFESRCMVPALSLAHRLSCTATILAAVRQKLHSPHLCRFPEPPLVHHRPLHLTMEGCLR